MTRRVLVTGSRNWRNYGAVSMGLTHQLNLTNDRSLVVVHGDARGADSMARSWAREPFLGGSITEEPHPAKWDEFCGKYCGTHRKSRRDGRTYCPRQGFLRNLEMAELGADVCLAFPMEGSRGTWGMMLLCEKRSIPVLNLGLCYVPVWFREEFEMGLA